MAERTDEPRIYGMADKSNKQPQSEQGLRGEKGASRPAGSRMVVAEEAEGRSIEVEEVSGVAFAEATGATGLERDETAPRGKTVTPGSLLVAVGAGALFGTLWGLLRRRRRDGVPAHAGPAAFTHAVTAPENFDQTRDAGLENIRDLPDDARWDVVDESSDESFPASDPPGSY